MGKAGAPAEQFAAQCLGCLFAPVAARFARAHRTANARARGLHPRQFAAECLRCQVASWAARSARAHQKANSRARRRRVKVSSTFSKVAGGAGARWAPSSARSPLPRRSVLDVCHWQTASEAAAERGAEPYGLPGVRGRKPLPSPTSKMGDGCPPLLHSPLDSNR